MLVFYFYLLKYFCKDEIRWMVLVFILMVCGDINWVLYWRFLSLWFVIVLKEFMNKLLIIVLCVLFLSMLRVLSFIYVFFLLFIWLIGDGVENDVDLVCEVRRFVCYVMLLFW